MVERRPLRPRPVAAPRAFAWSRGGRRLLRTALDEAVTLLAADGGQVYLATEPDGELAHLLATGISDEPPGGRYGGEGISGCAVALGRPFWTGDDLADQRFTHLEGTDAWGRENGVRSAITAVIGATGSQQGVLTLFSSRPWSGRCARSTPRSPRSATHS